MRSKFEIQSFDVEGVLLLKKNRLKDDRGYFERLYCLDSFKEFSAFQDIKQMNHSLTIHKGTIRGLHFQHFPYQETKVVTCTQGSIYDVAVDLRKDSITYGQYVGVILDALTQNSLLIPKGFAHGFQALSDDAEIMYFNDEYYQSSAEEGIYSLDPQLNINWPLPPRLLSDKDQKLPTFEEFTKKTQ